MYIKTFQISNYMGFRETEELAFSPDMNLIVGQNNVGKSSLLDCLKLRFVSRPTLNAQTKPTSTSTYNPLSDAIVELGSTGSEIKQILIGNGGLFFLPLPPNADESPQGRSLLVDELFEMPEIVFRMGVRPAGGSAEFLPVRYPSHGSFEGNPEDPNCRMLQVQVTPDRQGTTQDGVSNTSAKKEFAYPVANELRERIYFFHAERLQIARSPIERSEVLDPNARNLPQVLHTLQTLNPALYSVLISRVSEVIPTVKWVSIPPTPQNDLEILVWPVGPDSQRHDLAISLNNCGTGVGQVLAMLYVILTSEVSRVLLIDEPASFLHPGAARKLIGIFQEFPQHQYIISTHSPEVISLVRSSPIFLVTSTGSESLIDAIDSSRIEDSRRTLLEVGAKLSDVYGADRIVWVEGPTEEECFPLIAARFELGDAGTIYRPVRDTGSFQSTKSREEILNIYSNLSQGRALLPPALAFVFDREQLSEEDVEDLARRGVSVLGRRMYENYLLDAEAIAHVLNETETFRNEAPIETKQVKDWLDADTADQNIETLNGGQILERMFSDVSGAREEFRKTVHSVDLTRFILEKDPEQFAEIRDLLEGIFLRNDPDP